ncbi:MAG TPA: M23 family metallopeptidase, partial [Chitinispirillaceae bacterium]|nr:M23 family metallopeptidase [Chitinispirillaceae bacterium]
LKVKMETPRIEIITKKSVYRFPLDFKYQDKGYHSGVRSFGSSRNNGTRFHAGCDLYAPVGSKVYAMDDGIFIDYYHFYGQTYAMEIRHGKRIIRYGEIQPPKDKHGYEFDIPPESVRKGFRFKEEAEIKRGQLIGYVGQLRFINKVTGVHENYKLSMVHLEMYNGDCGGILTQNNWVYSHIKVLNYSRRSDLLNPTEFLDNCISE